jgi:ribonuclease BN (tRNA processing enzyme)
VIDATYTDAEYAAKIGWGHSCVSRVAEVAHQAKVGLLCLYHHDPDQLDKDITYKVQEGTDLLQSLQSSTRCIAPKEGEKIVITD